MKKLLMSLVALMTLCVSAQGKTVQSVVFPQRGLVVKVNVAFTMTSPLVTYTDATTDSTCASATVPGFTWASPTPALQTANGGTFNNGVITWSSSYDPHGSNYPFGAFTALGVVQVTCGGVTDTATMLAQSTVASNGTADTFYMVISPVSNFYQDYISGTNFAPTLVQGATMQVGLGVAYSSSIPNLNPASMTCNWSSSNTAIATVDQYGHVTAGTTNGNVIITCTQSGNGVFGTYSAGNDFFGNSIGGTAGVNRWEFTVVNPTPTLNTYYVRTDGGTPYVNGTLTPFGQCTGLADAAYTGTTNQRWWALTAYTTGTVIVSNNGHYQTATTGGTSGTVSNAEPAWTGTTTTDGTITWTQGATYPVNQACAIGNFRDLWTDQVSGNHVAWMIGAGDTVIVRKPVSGFYANGYAVGPDTQNPVNTGTAGGKSPINCASDAQDCYMPSIPSGTSAHHTKIYGENAGAFTGTSTSCRADTAKTKLLETWAVKNGINTRDSQFVDVACFELTQVAACARNGNYTNACTESATATVGNYGRNGILQSAMTSNVTYTDILIDGLAVDGFFGASADQTVVGDNIHIRGLPDAGINMDDAPNGQSNYSVAGGLTLTNSITEFSGCVEEKPVVHNYPYIECRDQSLGGYADGFGTAATSGTWVFDHDIWRYNYQDGLDLLHSGLQNLTVTNSQSYGNDGNQYKIGSAQNVVFRNNSSLSNCARIGFVIGDEPSSAIIPGVNLCRAGGGLNFHFYAYGNYLVQSNTINGYADVQFQYSCEAGSEDCHTANTVLQDNAFLSMSNTTQPNGNSAQFCPANMPGQTDCNGTNSLYPANQGWATRDHNLYYNTRSCPTSLLTGETCNTSNPLFSGQPGTLAITTESVLDSFSNPAPATGSPLLLAGTTYTGIASVDMNGLAVTSPPVIGALNMTTTPITNFLMFGAGKLIGAGVWF